MHPSISPSLLMPVCTRNLLLSLSSSPFLPSLLPSHSESVHPAAQIIDAFYVPGIVLGPRNPEWEIVEQRRQALEKDCFMVFRLGCEVING